MRSKGAPTMRASVRTSRVFAIPGTPSISACWPVRITISAWSMACSCPMMTLRISSAPASDPIGILPVSRSFPEMQLLLSFAVPGDGSALSGDAAGRCGNDLVHSFRQSAINWSRGVWLASRLTNPDRESRPERTTGASASVAESRVRYATETRRESRQPHSARSADTCVSAPASFHTRARQNAIRRKHSRFAASEVGQQFHIPAVRERLVGEWLRRSNQYDRSATNRLSTANGFPSRTPIGAHSGPHRERRLFACCHTDVQRFSIARSFSALMYAR